MLSQAFAAVRHAIPEGLGNKNIILDDGCDECNEFFGNNEYFMHFNIAQAIQSPPLPKQRKLIDSGV